MKYFRCLVCAPQPDGYEFVVEKYVPVVSCPRCHAVYPGIVELTLTHFLYANPKGAILSRPAVSNPSGRYTMACQPERRSLGNGVTALLASDFPSVVTCPTCRAHPMFREMLAIYGINPQEEDPAIVGGLRIEGKCC